MEQTKFAGVPFPLGDRMIVLPALNLKQLKGMRATLSQFLEFEAIKAAGGEVDFFEMIDVAAKIITPAVQRNYPEYTADDVEDAIDMNNFRDAINAIMGQSGLTLTKVAEVQEPSTGEG